MKRYLSEHWDTVLCIGLSILLAIGGVLAYFCAVVRDPVRRRFFIVSCRKRNRKSVHALG